MRGEGVIYHSLGICELAQCPNCVAVPPPLREELVRQRRMLETLLEMAKRPVVRAPTLQRERTPAERKAFEIITNGGKLGHDPDTERRISELAAALEKAGAV